MVVMAVMGLAGDGGYVVNAAMGLHWRSKRKLSFSIKHMSLR